MPARITLLGPPQVERDGTPLPRPRGSKAWALLAYLVLTEVAPPRSRLMTLLFDEADDPAAALRWSLSQLRHALTGVADVGSDPLRLDPRPGTVIDARIVAEGSWQAAMDLPTIGGTLLDGVNAHVSPAFELWLSMERRRLSGRTAALLHEAAHTRLAHGQSAAAVDLAARRVAVEPLDESGHELLVRLLVASGDQEAAAAAVRDCRALLRRELGREPSPAVAAALRTAPVRTSSSGRVAVEVAIDGGVAAAHAGAYERALELLRGAVDDGRGLGEREVLARALMELGTALVHGVRGRHEEGVSRLHEAVTLAELIGDRRRAAAGAREIGYVETLRAHYAQMESWFARAASLADGAPEILAWVDLYAGIGRTDQGSYARAASALQRAVRRAASAGARRPEAYALAALGRWHLLRDELPAAAQVLDAACSAAQAIGWSALLPFPRALRAEVALLDGDLTSAEDGLDRAYVQACQVGDPCWEAYSLRGRGLLAAARADDAAALDLLLEAPTACRRLPGTHAWVEGHCLEALCRFAVDRDLPQAATWVAELEAFASRRGMRELVARAVLHRRALGQPGAAALATELIGAIDNPSLAALVSH